MTNHSEPNQAKSDNPMSPRLKKFLGMFILLGGFFIYVVIAITIADFLPHHRVLEIVYFAIAGIAWIFPVKRLLEWMNREPEERA